MPHLNVLTQCLLPRLRRTWLSAAALLLACLPALSGQASQREQAYRQIGELRQGILVLRLPTDQNKIDTLESLRRRATGEKARKAIDKELAATIAGRDRRTEAYTKALREAYRFSKAAYVFDREVMHPESALLHFITPAGDSVVRWSQVDPSRMFQLHFDHTPDSGIEALIVHGPDGRIPPDPFPSIFLLGGFNSFWNGLMGTGHEMWRIRSINKQFASFYLGVERIRAAEDRKSLLE